MATSHRSATAGAGVASASITPTLPTGWQPGDIVAITSGHVGGAAIGTPAGWTAGAAERLDSTVRSRLWYRKMQVGDTAPTFTSVGASTSEAHCECVQGTNPQWDTGLGATTASGTAHAAPSITTGANNAFVGGSWVSLTAACTFSNEDGGAMTERSDASNMAQADQIQASAGASGTKTATSSATTTTHAFTYSVIESTATSWGAQLWQAWCRIVQAFA